MKVGSDHSSAQGRQARSACAAGVLALLLGCAGAWPACTPPPAPLDVEARVGSRALPPGWGDARFCPVAGETRPSVGCRRVAMLPDGETFERDGRTWQRYRITSGRFPGRVAVQRRVRAGEGAPWAALEPVLFESPGQTVEVPFPATPGSERQVTAWAVWTFPQRHVLDPIALPAGARLSGGFAATALGPEPIGGPVEFRLSLEAPDGEVELLRRKVEPETLEAGWQEYAIDLSHRAGESVTLVQSTRLVGDATDGSNLAAMWSRPLVLAPARTNRPSVLLISLDTLRADHVGATRENRRLTENLDRLAEDGVIFGDVTAPYPSTTASHMSLFTGVYPRVHRVFAPGDRLDPRIPTLAESLAAEGYRTASITENAMIVRGAGFARGFDSYVEFSHVEVAEPIGHVAEVFQRARSWLEQYGHEDFFLFLHTYQVHDPYTPPEEFDRFEPEGEGVGAADLAKYAGEVVYTDAEIGRLLDALDELGLGSRTAVFVTSDHGEGFGEHGVFGHRFSLIEEVIRVPLHVRGPGLMAGLEVEAPTSLVDVPATVLEIAGLQAHGHMQGVSLARLAKGEADERTRGRTLYTERELQDGGLEVGARRGPEKWIVSGDRATRFDLDRDPGEAAGRVLDRRTAGGAEALVQEYHVWAEAVRSDLGVSGRQSFAVDRGTAAKLAALGYVDIAESVATAEALPPGSYRETCRDCRLSKGLLECDCRSTSGAYTETRKKLDDCGRGFANRDGQLVCEGAG